MKTCTKCNVEKELTEFHKSSNRKDGLYPQCKVCANETKLISKSRMTQEQKIRHREQIAAWRKNNPDKVREQDRRRNLRAFNLTSGEYDALLESQGGGCAICHTVPSTRRLAIDHDHKCCPGKNSCGKCIRGLLCVNCNTALGLLDDDINKIMKVIRYLENK